MDPFRNHIELAADLIKNSKHMVALTGAGISTESGIPDFRSPGSGLWTKFDPIKVASISSFERDPSAFYEMGKELFPVMLEAKPNAGHLALAELERMGKLHSIITQNIDNLHRSAGSTSAIEVHGNILRFRCMSCSTSADLNVVKDKVIDKGEMPPLCDACGGVIRPDVVFFGEMLPMRELCRAEEESKNCDLMIVLGTSLVMGPVNMMPHIAVSNGAHLIIISLDETYMDHRADVVMHERVGEVLPKIVELVKHG